MKRRNILAHRGVWYNPEEKNTPAALVRSFAMGFGIETDFRDLAGRLVVSHDPPAGDCHYDAVDLFADYAKYNTGGRLALNIKADGLQSMLTAAFRESAVDQRVAFAFDMAVPDALGYLAEAFPTYTRMSEYEKVAPFLDRASGVWVDNFTGSYPQVEICQSLLAAGHRVAFVSPELHKRDHTAMWNSIFDTGLHRNRAFELCTDLPEAAFEKFGDE